MVFVAYRRVSHRHKSKGGLLQRSWQRLHSKKSYRPAHVDAFVLQINHSHFWTTQIRQLFEKNKKPGHRILDVGLQKTGHMFCYRNYAQAWLKKAQNQCLHYWWQRFDFLAPFAEGLVFLLQEAC